MYGDMEWIEKLLIAIAGIVTAVGGFTTIRFFFTRKEEKRKAEAEAYDVALDALRRQYDWLHEQNEEMNKTVKALNEKVDTLYAEVHALERKNLDLVKQNAELELQLKGAQHNACVRPDDDCLRRLPPRDYCRLRKLARGDYDKDYEGKIDDKENQ